MLGPDGLPIGDLTSEGNNLSQLQSSTALYQTSNSNQFYISAPLNFNVVTTSSTSNSANQTDSSTRLSPFSTINPNSSFSNSPYSSTSNEALLPQFTCTVSNQPSSISNTLPLSQAEKHHQIANSPSAANHQAQRTSALNQLMVKPKKPTPTEQLHQFYDRLVNEIKEGHAKAVELLVDEHAKAVERLIKGHAKRVERLVDEHAKAISRLKESYEH